MPIEGKSVLAVVLAIADCTIGWGKECDVISRSQMSTRTGIAGKSTLSLAIQTALDRGYILRTKKGNSFSYSVASELVLKQDTQKITRIKDSIDRDIDAVFAVAVKSYEDGIGPINKDISDMLQDAVDTFPAGWIPLAIREAVKYNARSWAYVQKVMENWQARGFVSSNGSAPQVVSKPAKDGGFYT